MIQQFIARMQAKAKETGEIDGLMTEAAIKAYLQGLDALHKKVRANGYIYNEDLFEQALINVNASDATKACLGCYQEPFKFAFFADTVKDLDVIAAAYGIREKVTA